MLVVIIDYQICNLGSVKRAFEECGAEVIISSNPFFFIQEKHFFFKIMILRKAQFVSGPFVDMVFEIIEKQKNKLKVLVGNITTTISDKGNYLYRHI